MKLMVSLSLIMLLAGVFAVCGDGICGPGETIENCPEDCGFGDEVEDIILPEDVEPQRECINDGICHIWERELGCPDCSTTGTRPANICIPDGHCSEAERALGYCPDCIDTSPGTAFMVVTGGLGIIGAGIVVLLLGMFVAFVAHSYLNSPRNKRIRM